MKKILLLLAAISSTACAQTPQGLSQELSNEKSLDIYYEEINNYARTIDESWGNRVLESGDYRMPFWYSVNGEMPEEGYDMYISMHGGGGTAPEVNDQQWENQKHLYDIKNGVYWVPRAPIDVWDLWHQGYMEDFLLQAVSYAVANLRVNPNRIYLTGYSAGGDGTFNLAPRLCDRFAAAAMMAGHPGDAEARNLRNIPFAIYVGGKDDGYNRNGLAAEWAVTLDSLEANDPEGYVHRVVIYPEYGHWMNRADAEGIEWMAQFERNASPDKIVWIQDDVLATRKYNLEVESPAVDMELVVEYDKEANSVNILKSDYNKVKVWLDDEIMDLDEPVTVNYNGEEIFSGMVERTEANIRESIAGRYDIYYIFPACIELNL